MPLTIAVLQEPVTAYGLLVVAAAGLLRVAYVPTAFVPGFAGVAAAVLALLAYLAAPPPATGVLLFALGIALLNAEFRFTTYGSAGTTGLVAAFCGSWQLLPAADVEPPFARVAIAGVGTLALLATVLGGWRRRTLPPQS